MSVLIKGMNMPQSCEKCGCLAVSFDWYHCNVKIRENGAPLDLENRNGKFIYTDKRHPNCPLVEIPTPHGRLIDADRLIAVMESAAGTQERQIPLSAVLGLIKNSKTIIEAEE